MDWETALAAGGPVSLVFGALGTWYLKIRSDVAKVAQTNADAELLRQQNAEKGKQDIRRGDMTMLDDQTTLLIKRMQAQLDGYEAKLAAVEAKSMKGLAECEERETAALERAHKSDTTLARAISHLRLLENQIKRYVKDWDLAPFQVTEDGTGESPKAKGAQ